MKNYSRIPFLFLFSVMHFHGYCQKNDSLSPSQIPNAVEKALPKEKIAGYVFAAVKDGQLIYEKSEGFADVESQVPVNFHQTVFRWGSISKLFVWISLFQLEERGLINLDDDIFDYLDKSIFGKRIPYGFPIKALMSHSAGFEDNAIGLFLQGPNEVQNLNNFLTRQLPQQVMPPFRFASYSNHGTTLAAHLVELVSGMEFKAYIQQNIFIPLGMQTATFSQNTKDQKLKYISKGYAYGENFSPQEFEILSTWPAGAISASGEDMFKFLLELTNLAAERKSRLIHPATFQKMISPAVTIRNGVNPVLHGLMNMSKDGLKIYGHWGDTIWFHALIAIIPEQDFGFIFSMNTSVPTPEPVYETLFNEVVKSFEVDRPMKAQSQANWELDLKKLESEYILGRKNHTGISKLISYHNRYKLTQTSETSFTLKSRRQEKVYDHIGDLFFQEKNSPKRIAFQKEETDGLWFFVDARHADQYFLQAKWYEKTDFQYFLFWTLISTTMAGLLFLNIYPLFSKMHPSDIIWKSLAPAIYLQGLLLLSIAFLAIKFLEFGELGLLFGSPPHLDKFLYLPWIFLACILYTTSMGIRYLVASKDKISFKAPIFIVILIQSIAIWQMYYWNLFSFKL
jgi:CubicO group peptidase (beta-lactamase class C family)